MQKISDDQLDGVVGGVGLPQDIATKMSDILASDEMPPMPQKLASHFQGLKDGSIKEPDTDLIMAHADYFKS